MRPHAVSLSHSILFAVCAFLLVPSGISGALMFVAVIKFHQSHIFNKPSGRFDFQLQAKVPFSPAPEWKSI
jgi:hypothetical protein